MKVVLAEKPSVAQDLAKFLGAKQKKNGYIEGNGYAITWAFGHLVTLKEPHEYNPLLKRWSLDTLPFIPENFQLKLTSNSGVRKQMTIIHRLFKCADEIICATDAGREGELIFRYILKMTLCESKCIKRLWLSSLTDEAIAEGFQNLKPGKDFNNLYAAAKCRSESDWIVGLNATRNITVRFGAGRMLWSVGRVQTPVLAMIVNRDEEIRHFISEPFWELMSQYRNVPFKYKGKRFNKKDKAEAFLLQVEGHPFQIIDIKKKKEKLLPPLLYDLTDLQRDMNRRYHLSAADTLKHAQNLYESKFITYPRTDSRYLSVDMKNQVAQVMHQLTALKAKDLAPLDLKKLPFSKRILNNKKINDHHAIIPTGKLPQGLPAHLMQIYDAVVTRFIAAFYPFCQKEVTSIEGTTNSIPFTTKGVRILEPGWTALYPKKKCFKDDEQELPAFIKGEEGPHKPFIREGKTQAPRHHTENSLLASMETAGKQVDDEELKEALKDKGLGTPATRASIIETLLSRGYLERKKKHIHPTDLGRYLIALVQDPHLKSAELTGSWEAKLKSIESGKLDPATFMKEIAMFTKRLIETSDVNQVRQDCFGPCPKCQNPVIEGHRGYGCSKWKEGCAFVLWKEFEGQLLTPTQIRRLLQHRVMLQALQTKEGKKVILNLNDKGQLSSIAVPDSSKQKKPNHRRPQQATRKR